MGDEVQPYEGAAADFAVAGFTWPLEPWPADRMRAVLHEAMAERAVAPALPNVARERLLSSIDEESAFVERYGFGALVRVIGS